MDAEKINIYVDADDDITSVIEQVKSADKDIIALMLPKRAEMLKSLVNMKLLNKAAKDSDKKLVLVTKDKNVESIAAAVNMYTAKTNKSKPSIPKDVQQEVKAKEAVVANHADTAIKPPAQEGTSKPPKDTRKAIVKSETKARPKKKKKPNNFKVPNFEAFRLKLGMGLLFLLLLPAAWYVAYRLLPSASFKIETNAKTIQLQTNLAAVSALPEESTAKEAVVMTTETSTETLSEKVIATGEKEVGVRASGLMTVSNCSDSPVTLPSGTGFSVSNLTFISQVDIELDSGNFTSDSVCKSTGGHVKTITAVATDPGDQYNLSSRAYAIAGSPQDVAAIGGNMAGGSSDIVAVIRQVDIDDAGSRLDVARKDQVAKSALVKVLKEKGLVALDDTFTATPSELVLDVALDQEVDQGSIAQTISYSMSGIAQTDVFSIIEPKLVEQAGALAIIDSGIDQAVYETTKTQDGYTVSVKVNALAGLILSEDEVYQTVLDRPADEAATDIRRLEGVNTVEVSTSPFWVTSVPSNQDKVTIEINGTE